MCQQLSDQAIELIAVRFRALGEPSRLKLIMALKEGGRNVSELVKATRLTQPNASRHLRTLTDAGILVRHRRKTEIYYALAVPDAFQLLLKVNNSLQKRIEDQANAFSR